MEEFQKYFSRPLFTIIFRTEMLKFHPFSILTGDTMVGFVIFCVLMMVLPDDHRGGSQIVASYMPGGDLAYLRSFKFLQY